MFSPKSTPTQHSVCKYSSVTKGAHPLKEPINCVHSYLNTHTHTLISVVSKICEILVKEKWVRCLEDNKVITNRQFGFRQGKSCVTNLLSFYTRVIEGIDNREGWMDAVYLDIKKAFDRAPHKRLLWKLKHIGRY